ncbi:BT_2262 family domain-containing protein [Membranihabitans marinus]|uniref:BT_2262 family domain-containing protein n=1 Tax=Membranihabitans marinus TaxID=1227546 RepID=UPI001F378C61|nr:BT_2262 family domain-containing protein [Membranihabitans marinus]
MKQIKIIALLCLAIGFFSCEEESDIVESKITYLPKFEAAGEDYIELTCVEDFVDPGTIAIEGGTEIDVNTVVKGKYFGASSVSTPDEYVISYSAVNVDGIPGAYMREVFKKPCDGDLVTNISGIYSSTVTRITGAVQADLNNVYIVQLSDNTYGLSHGIGGYYDLGLEYGPDYASLGAVITANDIGSNDFTVSDATFPVWGNVVQITNFKVDASTGTITYHGSGNFGNGEFDVVLKKK